MADKNLQSITFPGLTDRYVVPQVDNTLTQAGRPADAKKTGDELTQIKADISDISQYTLGLYPQVEVASTPVASFDDGADDIPIKAMKVAINPVQAGSGDPSSDNIREIVGWTGTGVHRAGVNLLGGELLVENAKLYIPGLAVNTDEKYIGFTSGASVDVVKPPNGFLGFCNCKENTVYTIIYTLSKSSGTGSNIRVNYTDGTYTSLPGLTDVSQKETKVFVTGTNKTVKSITKTNMSGTTRLYYDEFGLFEGVHTIDEFVPYAGQTVDIDWTDEAGTVYGGTLDVTSGVLTVTYGNISSYNGETLPGEWISDRDVYVAGTTPTTGAQVVYELAEAQTYQLTPTEVRTLLGLNNIWADTGDVELTYRASLDRYFDDKVSASQALMELLITANRESTMTASQAYSEGDLVIISGTLYKVASSIASGATFTPGTNVIATTVAAELATIA